MALEDSLDDAALHATASAVDEADLRQAAFVSGPQVFFDDRRDVARFEGMKVEFWVDGDDVGRRRHKRGLKA
jgi:hypothetical protein